MVNTYQYKILVGKRGGGAYKMMMLINAPSEDIAKDKARDRVNMLLKRHRDIYDGSVIEICLNSSTETV